jgi:hypothetical protein
LAFSPSSTCRTDPHTDHLHQVLAQLKADVTVADPLVDRHQGQRPFRTFVLSIGREGSGLVDAASDRASRANRLACRPRDARLGSPRRRGTDRSRARLARRNFRFVPEATEAARRCGAGHQLGSRSFRARSLFVRHARNAGGSIRTRERGWRRGLFAGEALYRGPDMGTVEAALANGLETARIILIPGFAKQ